MKKKQFELIEVEGIYEFWKSISKNLEKKDLNINFVDFDDTLFSRLEQLKGEKILREKRGHEGAKLIFEEIGIDNFLKKYYINRNIPLDILSKMNSNIDVILTAGICEFQISKIRLFKELDNFKIIVTKSSKEKVIRLIRYILFELKFIPSKITIYEDRPQYFIEFKDLIENVLLTKLEIIRVQMNEKKGYKKIEIINGL